MECNMQAVTVYKIFIVYANHRYVVLSRREDARSLIAELDKYYVKYPRQRAVTSATRLCYNVGDEFAFFVCQYGGPNKSPMCFPDDFRCTVAELRKWDEEVTATLAGKDPYGDALRCFALQERDPPKPKGAWFSWARLFGRRVETVEDGYKVLEDN
jgi:hypothetical protein